MTERLKKLRAIALAAAGHKSTRPRSWASVEISHGLDYQIQVNLPSGEHWRIGEADYKQVAEHFAAFDPETCLELLDRIAELEADKAGFDAELSRLNLLLFKCGGWLK